jgi:hypothetical protein
MLTYSLLALVFPFPLNAAVLIAVVVMALVNKDKENDHE